MEDSVLHFQNPNQCVCFGAVKSTPTPHSRTLNTRFKISPLLRLRFPSAFFYISLRLKYCMHFSSPQTCYVTHPFCRPWFNRPNTIRWRVPIMMICDIHFSWSSCYFSFRISNYSFQHLVPTYVTTNLPQLVSLWQEETDTHKKQMLLE